MNRVEQRFVKAISKRISDRCKEMVDYQSVQHRKLKMGNLAVGVGTDENIPRHTRQVYKTLFFAACMEQKLKMGNLAVGVGTDENIPRHTRQVYKTLFFAACM
ncbi:unnamed protein product [Gongylonema pulchrum]|uniref:Uncharacterized protein n=1 Tax=Gongylonema pulchrum TaxID=637853 RepID=A0A3P7PJ48_9BILA|nr:unnamed protein product [Gongylonema pulchrum]